MNKTKIFFLFLILALPVLIYLFLQGFGKNHFAIPVYYTDGISNRIGDCPPERLQAPYQLNNQFVKQLIGDDVGDAIVVYELGNGNTDRIKDNLYTFLDKYKQNELIKLVSLRTEADSSRFSSRYRAWLRYNLADSNLLIFGRCILQLNLNNQFMADSGLVLVDQQRRIRGYYDPEELKEIDRLNTELYILLNEE